MLFVTYNIQYGRGRDGRFDLPRVAEELRGADVISLQEVERNWRRSGQVDQPVELAGLLGDYHWVYGPGVDLFSRARAGRGPDSRRQFGNQLLSRTPILSSRNHLLPKYASTGPMSVQRTALEAVIEVGAELLRVYSVHLTHLSEQTRMPQVERLLEIHRDAPFEGAAIAGGMLEDEWVDEAMPPALPYHAVIMGDFNMEPSSREYDRVTGPVSPYGGRITNPHGLVDAWVQCGNPEDEGASADIRGRPVRLDYCFVSAALADRIRSVRIDNEACGSDHQPVWMELDI